MKQLKKGNMKSVAMLFIIAFICSCSNKNTKKESVFVDEQQKEIIKKTPIKVSEKTLLQKPKVIVSQSNKNTLTKKNKEIPLDGTYIYDIVYAEWQGESMGEKVKVVIKGNIVKIISEGNPSMTAKKGEILDEGKLIKHNITGEWLITNNPSDANLEVYGGCVGAPMVIDFVHKKYYTC